VRFVEYETIISNLKISPGVSPIYIYIYNNDVLAFWKQIYTLVHGETEARPGSVVFKYPAQDCLTDCRNHVSNPDTGEKIPGCFCRLKTPYSHRKVRKDGVHDIGVLYHYGECAPENPGCRAELEEDSDWSILRTNCPENYQYCSNCPPPPRCVPRGRDCEKNAQTFSAKHYLEPKNSELEAKGEECIDRRRPPRGRVLRPSSRDQRTLFHNFKCTTSEDCLNRTWPGKLRNLRDHREKYGDRNIYRYTCSCKISNKYERWADLDNHLKKLAKAVIKSRKDAGHKVKAGKKGRLYLDLKEGKRNHWTETPTYKRLKEEMFDLPSRDRETYIDVNLRNYVGNTPLEEAAEEGKRQIVNRLLEDERTDDTALYNI